MRFHSKSKLCLVPSLAGILIFYLIPYIRVIYYSFIKSQFKKEFVGLQNYIDVLSNSYFQLALKNTSLLIIIAVPLIIVFALILSIVFAHTVKWLHRTRFAFITPMVLPAAGVITIWKAVFSSFDSVLPIYLLYFWKNTGILIIILTAALSTIEKEVVEASRLDGVSGFQRHRYITIPLIFPSILFSVLLSIVNSFKIFRESYLYYGNNYPPDHSYTLQYYMNNHFLKLNYQKLSVSAMITSFLILIIIGLGFFIQRRFSSDGR